MRLQGLYLVGKEGASITWSDGSTQALVPNARVRLDSSDPGHQPVHVQGRLVRLGVSGPTYEAPQREPRR